MRIIVFTICIVLLSFSSFSQQTDQAGSPEDSAMQCVGNPGLMYSLIHDKADSAFRYLNSVQLEFGGHGLFYSLNYERILINSRKFKTTFQAGLGYYPPETGIIEYWMPVLVNEAISFQKQHIEVGIGCVFTNEKLHSWDQKTTTWEWNQFGAFRLGYRYQKPGGRIVLRAAFTPFIDYREMERTEIHPSGGVSVGYCFGA